MINHFYNIEIANGYHRYMEFIENAGTYISGEELSTRLPRNKYFGGLDAVCLYAMIAEHYPRNYVEIGSGYSTRVAYMAVSDFDINTSIVSIDPEPRDDIDGICNERHRRKLLLSDTAWITQNLLANDILFIDGSHILEQNSDVQIAWCEIIPVLGPGVIVHLHDIWLPVDYPEEWKERKYNEQYVLAAALAAAPNNFEILCANGYISAVNPTVGVGKSFWFRTRY